MCRTSVATMGALSLMTIPLAYISWRFVELPFRNKQYFTRRQIFVLCGALTALFAGIGLVGQLKSGFSGRYSFNTKFDYKWSEGVRQYSCHLQAQDLPVSSRPGDCFAKTEKNYSFGETAMQQHSTLDCWHIRMDMG